MDASARLLQALEQGDDVAALGHALDLWTVHRDPGLARLVDVLDEQVRAATKGPRGRRKEEFHDAWCGLADTDDSPVATGWLCATLTSKLPIHTDRFGMLREQYVVEKFAALLERVARLAPRCPDPRIARAITTLLERGTYGYWDPASVEPLYRPIVEVLVKAGDPSIAQPLQDLVDTPRAKLASVREWSTLHLPALIRQCRRLRTTPPPPAVAEAVARLVAVGSGPRLPEEADELLQQVLADPSDLDARAVLADLWIEAGDPRGRFVVRQLQGHGEDDAEVRRMLREHRAEWLGPDLDATLQVTFVNGFPYEGALRQNHKASEEVWLAAATDPRLATFEVVRQGNGNQRWYEQFVCSPQAVNLRTVEIPSRGLIEAVARRPEASLQRVELGVLPTRAVAQALATSDGLGSVCELSVPLAGKPRTWLGHIRRSAFAERLEVLDVVGPTMRTMWFSSPPKTRIVEHWPDIAALPRLRRFRLHNGWALSIDLERADDGWILRLVGPGSLGAGEPLVQDGPVWLAPVPLDPERLASLRLYGGPLPVELMDLPEGVVRVEAALLPEGRAALAERWGVPVGEVEPVALGTAPS